jgi:hypothetical protein
VPSGEQFTEWVASVREIYDSGDKTAATDISLAGAREIHRPVRLPGGSSVARCGSQYLIVKRRCRALELAAP